MAKDALYWSLYKKIGRVVDKAFDEYCEPIPHKMNDFYRRLIDFYYNDYTPLYYRRTGSLYLAASTHDDHFEENRSKIFNKFSQYGGIHGYNIKMEIDPKYIPGNPYRAEEKEWVFYRVFGGRKPYESKFKGKTKDGRRNFAGLVHGFTYEENQYWGKKGRKNRKNQPTKWVKVKHVPRSKSNGIVIIVDGINFRSHTGDLNKRTNLNIVLNNRIKDYRQLVYADIKAGKFSQLLETRLREAKLYNG